LGNTRQGLTMPFLSNAPAIMPCSRACAIA
jgi:hypothetical protein